MNKKFWIFSILLLFFVIFIESCKNESQKIISVEEQIQSTMSYSLPESAQIIKKDKNGYVYFKLGMKYYASYMVNPDCAALSLVIFEVDMITATSK